MYGFQSWYRVCRLPSISAPLRLNWAYWDNNEVKGLVIVDLDLLGVLSFFAHPHISRFWPGRLHRTYTEVSAWASQNESDGGPKVAVVVVDLSLYAAKKA